jgi:hypothetical protein
MLRGNRVPISNMVKARRACAGIRRQNMPWSLNRLVESGRSKKRYQEKVVTVR